MKRVFYFAYGSNMLLERLAFRVGHMGNVVAHSIHRLYGYKLVFNSGFKKESFANIVKAEPTDFVEGVLYELNQVQIASLNQYEGYPYAYEQQFFLLPSGDIAFAYVSVDDFRLTKALPSLHYINIMILGALENKLYTTYNMLVTYKNQHYALKKGNKFKLH